MVAAILWGTKVVRRVDSEEQPGPNLERLQKVLSAHGVASRRAAEDMIARGEVTVNGVVAQLGQRVDAAADHIVVRGTPLQPLGARTYLALNNPVGYVTTLAATHGERTVVELLPKGGRVFPVGRLDKESSGLLLLTDDGEWAERIMHPRFEVEKEYWVLVRGRLSAEDLRALRDGLVLPDGARTAPARVRVLGEGPAGTELGIIVIEGKKRQIRLMCAEVRHPVVSLRRVRVGSIRLGTLGEGHWRKLTEEEIASVYRIAGRETDGGARAGRDRDRRASRRR